MQDQRKTKTQLIAELEELRARSSGRFFAMDQFLSSVVDEANIWVNVLDRNANVLLWNKVAESISGYSREEVVGHSKIWEWLYPDEDYRREITAKVAAIIEEGELVENFETNIFRKDGKHIIISWHSRNFQNEDGTPFGSITVGRDITDRKEFVDRLRESERRYRTLVEELQLVREHTEKKVRVRTHQLTETINEQRRAEEYLRESEERYRNLFEHSIDGIIVHDMQGAVIDANPRALELLGYSRREILKHTVPDLHPKHSRKESQAALEAISRKGNASFEIDFLRKNGTTFPAEVSASVFHIHDKPFVQGILRDISKRREAEEKLKKERDLAKLYLDIAEVIMVVIDTNQKVCLINRKGCEVLGYSEQEIIGQNWFDCFIPKTIRKQTKQAFSQIMNGRIENHKYGENHVLTSTGKERLVAWHNTILEDDRRHIYGTLSSGIDITRQRQAIMALKEREELYRKLLETSPDAIIITELDGTIIMLNQWASKLFGPLETHRATPETIANLIAKKDRARARKNGRRLLHQGIIRRIPYTMHKQDGAAFIAELSTSLLTNEAGQPTGCINIIRDITMRRQAEDVLNLYQRLLQFTRDGVYRYTFEDGKIIYSNQGLVDIFDLDCDPQDLEGKFMKDLLIYTEREGTIREQLALKGEIHGYEYQFKTLKGEDRWVIHDSFIVKEPMTNERIVEAVVKDITAYKQAENKLFRYQDQLRSLASKLVLAEEAERRRLATLLHDTIGSTMALSKIKLGAMRGTLSSPDQRKELDFIRELLEQAIKSSRSLTFELSPPVLYDLGLEAALEWLLEETQKQHDITCSFITDNLLKPLNEDVRILLFQAIREVLVNVAKHAKATQIIVSSTIHKEDLLITVEDNGIGFDPSRTVSSAPSKGGFGLFSLRERLRQLGGHFGIESVPGTGTRVTLTASLKGK